MTPTFNGYGEVTSATTAFNDVTVARWTLEYDNAGRITGKTETIGGNTSTYTYTYDAMSRLLTVTRNGAVVEEYEYDAQGRRAYEFNSLRGIDSRIPAYDDNDRLETSGNYGYEFDDDGFLTAKTYMGTPPETTTYTYARNGQLSRVELPDSTLIEYVYNVAGQRVAKKVGGVITEKYLWAGLTGLLAVYDGSDNLLMRFEGAKMVKNGQTYYLITDQVGSVRAVCDASGNIVKEITYDSFGNILDDTAPTFTMPLGFAGGLHDRDTGLVRFGLRDYDPDTGLWTAKDPIGFGGGSTNVYTYCFNDPVNLIDVLGLLTESQLQNLRMLIEMERDLGTTATCLGNSNTISYFVFGNENVPASSYRDFDNAPIPTPWGPIDLDYFMDIRGMGPWWATHPFLWTWAYDARYLAIRGMDSLLDLGKDMPYEDPKEALLLLLMRRGKDTFAELFPPEWMDKLEAEMQRKREPAARKMKVPESPGVLK